MKQRPYDFIKFLTSPLIKTPTEIAVLLMLHFYKNSETGECFPSHELLMSSCKISKSTLIRSLNELRNRGLIDWEHGKYNKNYYKFSLEDTLVLR